MTEANLGCATSQELRHELAVREEMGHGYNSYRTTGSDEEYEAQAAEREAYANRPIINDKMMAPGVELMMTVFLTCLDTDANLEVKLGEIVGFTDKLLNFDPEELVEVNRAEFESFLGGPVRVMTREEIEDYKEMMRIRKEAAGSREQQDVGNEETAAE